jgi:hypothetical protein
VLVSSCCAGWFETSLESLALDVVFEQLNDSQSSFFHAARKLVELLRELASAGRCIITTIHQVRARACCIRWLAPEPILAGHALLVDLCSCQSTSQGHLACSFHSKSTASHNPPLSLAPS